MFHLRVHFSSIAPIAKPFHFKNSLFFLKDQQAQHIDLLKQLVVQFNQTNTKLLIRQWNISTQNESLVTGELSMSDIHLNSRLSVYIVISGYFNMNITINDSNEK